MGQALINDDTPNDDLTNDEEDSDDEEFEHCDDDSENDSSSGEEDVVDSDDGSDDGRPWWWNYQPGIADGLIPIDSELCRRLRRSSFLLGLVIISLRRLLHIIPSTQKHQQRNFIDVNAEDLMPLLTAEETREFDNGMAPFLERRLETCDLDDLDDRLIAWHANYGSLLYRCAQDAWQEGTHAELIAIANADGGAKHLLNLREFSTVHVCTARLARFAWIRVCMPGRFQEWRSYTTDESQCYEKMEAVINWMFDFCKHFNITVETLNDLELKLTRERLKAIGYLIQNPWLNELDVRPKEDSETSESELEPGKVLGQSSSTGKRPSRPRRKREGSDELTSRQLELLAAFWRLNGSYQRVADEFNISRQAAKQIVDKAVQKSGQKLPPKPKTVQPPLDSRGGDDM